MPKVGRSPYRMPAWQIMRRYVLPRDHWRCQIGLPGCTELATEVDHIIPWRDPPELGGAWFDPANLRAACKSCNVARRNHKRSDTDGTARMVVVPQSREW